MKAGELLSILSQTGSAPFTPSQVAGMVEWHAATSLSLTDGDPIGTWADLSGNGFSATATTTARPTYKTNVVNSHPVARFNGTSNCLTLGFTGTKSQPNTYYIVLTDATGNVNHYQDDASFATRNLVGINSTAYQIYAGSALTGGVRTLDTFQIIEAVFNG